MSAYTKNMSKTLPGPLRQRRDTKSAHQEANGHTHSPLFGLNLNLNFSNLISSGVNFLDHLRKKTPTVGSPVSTPGLPGSRSSSTISGSPVDLPSLEQIEMTAFPCVGDALPGQTGAGHEWGEFSVENPTWCDLCGDLIWGLYDTEDWQCELCSYTVHNKCRGKVILDCSTIHTDSVDGIVQSIVSDTIEDGIPDTSTSSIYSSALEDTLQSSYTSARADSLASDVFQSTLLDTISGVLEETVSVSDTDDEYHTLKDVDELQGDVPHLPSLFSLPTCELDAYVVKYNKTYPTGQETVLEDGAFKGFIRVEMNLTRPINVISGTRPPSIYNILKEDTVSNKTLTTFYLPQGTEKALHITSHTTTQDVIKSLLSKFRVADNPHKYALYERNDEIRKDSLPRSKSLSRLKMRRMNEDERPLVLSVLWAQNNEFNKKIVLQENDPGEIQWEQFSLPELKNFLLILDREEAWYKRRIHEKYDLVTNIMTTLAQEKKPTLEEDEVEDLK